MAEEILSSASLPSLKMEIEYSANREGHTLNTMAAMDSNSLEKNNNFQNGTSIEDDLQDSPVSCREDPEVIKETVAWSNAAFIMNNTRDSMTSSNHISMRSNSPSADGYSHNSVLSRSSPNPSSSVQRHHAERSLDRRQDENFQQDKTKLPQKTSSPSLVNVNSSLQSLSGFSVSQTEDEIRAELEREIENEIEEEIKDQMFCLTRRLALLHARKKIRRNEHNDDEEKLLEHYRFNVRKICGKSVDGTLRTFAKNLDSESPQTPPPTRSFRHFRRTIPKCMPSVEKDSEKKVHKDSEKKVQSFSSGKEFDWVKTLRSGTAKPPTIAAKKKRSNTIAAPERYKNSSSSTWSGSSSSLRECSRTLLPEFNETRVSLSEPSRLRRPACRSSFNSFFSNKDNGKSYPPKDNYDTSSSSSAATAHTFSSSASIPRKLPAPKKVSFVGVEETKPGEKVQVKPKEERMYLTDLMNKMKISDTNPSVFSKKQHFSDFYGRY